MIARTCYLLVALVTLAGGYEDEALATRQNVAASSGAFNRGAVEHRPDSDEIRRIQQDFTRNKLISELSDDLVLDDERSVNAPLFNAHSYQTDRIEDAPEELVRSVDVDPASVIRTGADYKVVCYLESWAIYRPEPMTTSPADVDPNGCTHVIYSFLGLDKTSLTVTILDADYEVIRGGFKAALALKRHNPALRIMIAIGGWAEGGKQYSQMVSSRETREAFIASVVEFMEKWQFDGFDLDWEYPGATDRDGRWVDKENFARLVEEMSAVFKPRGWLLTAAVPAAIFRINEGYDVPRLAAALDFINVMTYDMHGTWDRYVDHHAPLYRRPFDQGPTQNLHSDGALSAWIQKGVPANKVIFGLPFYGRNFRLANADNWKPRAPSAGAGQVGDYTKEAGFVAYFEICEWLREGGWTERTDEAGSPYLVKGDQWVGYDNVESLKEKTDYIKTRGLGGAMIWAIGLDDVHGVCGEKRPLLRAVNEGLGRFEASEIPDSVSTPTTEQQLGVTELSTSEPTQVPQPVVTLAPLPEPTEIPSLPEPSEIPSLPEPTQSPSLPDASGGDPAAGQSCFSDNFMRSPNDCSRFFRCDGLVLHEFVCPPGLYYDERISVCNWPFLVDCQANSKATVAKAEHSSPVVIARARSNNDYKVVCYFSSWAWLRRGDGQFVPENVIPATCTHVLYAYAGLDPVKLVLKSNDIWTDLSNMMYKRVASLKRNNPQLRVMLTLGGWTESGESAFSRLVNDARARANFAQQAVTFLRNYGFDGLHLDWQYPVCWQADCKRGPASDRENYALLAKDIKREFTIHGLGLGVNVAGYTKLADTAFDAIALAEAADFISVLSYDFHGSWEKVTGHTSPLRSTEGDSVESAMNYWKNSGIPADKLLVGISTYGQSFSLSSSAGQRPGIGSRAQGAGFPGPYTQQAGMLAYYEICSLVRKGALTEVKNDAPFAFGGNQWVSYDNVDSVRRKAEWIRREGFGGAMIFSVDMDDFSNECCFESFPLIKAVARVLNVRADVQPASGSCERPPPAATPPPIPLTTGFDSGQVTKPTTPATFFPPATQPTTPRPQTRPPTTAPTTSRPPTLGATRPPTQAATRPPPTRPTTFGPTRPTSTASPATSCVNGEYYTVPGECASFYRCVNGELRKSKCSPGLFWNRVETLCDWPEKVNCGAGSVTVAPPVPSSTRVTPPPLKPTEPTTSRPRPTSARPTAPSIIQSAGPCQEGEYSPSGYDCSVYLWCINGQYIERKCPLGLNWNNANKVCDWPASAKCTTGIQNVAATQRPTARPTTTMRPTTARPTSPQRPPSVVSTTTRPSQPGTTATPPAPIQPATPGKYKMICYYTNWSWYRQGEGKYSPTDIDTDLCTHIIYGFATLDPSQLVMRVFDSWCDTDEYGPKLYAKVTALKSKGIKVLIALGGWNDSLGNKYSRLVNDPAARKRFIDNAIVFIEKYGFDGLDLDWEYPKCWQVDCNAGPASDKSAFAALVKELRAAFSPRGWLLSAAVSPSKTVIDAGYDVPSISRDLDWIGVMTYDYHGHWDKKTGHVAPLSLHSQADVAYFNTNYTLNYWIRLGADPSKIILGAPLYGQSFTLENPRNNGLNAPAKATGQAGEYTRQGGFLAYYEICKQIQNGGWTVVQDSEGAMGPYAYRSDQWVSFDDVSIMRRKAELVRTMNLGGAMIWALDLDDFRNRCGCEKYPLLKMLNRVLRGYPLSSASCANNPLRTSTIPGMVIDENTDSISVWSPESAKSTCSSDSFRAHESDCKLYYICVDGRWSVARCPAGLTWNKDHCGWSYNGDCGAAA